MILGVAQTRGILGSPDCQGSRQPGSICQFGLHEEYKTIGCRGFDAMFDRGCWRKPSRYPLLNLVDCLPIHTIFKKLIMSRNKDGQPVISSSKDVAECVQLEDSAGSSDPSLEKLEQHREITPRDIQARFDLLRDLSDADMEKLNKSVVKKIDWRMMPTITMMFLMR